MRERERERERERLIYYEELAHMMMEAEKSQDLQLVNWRLRRADGIVTVHKTSRSETPKELMFQLVSKGRNTDVLPQQSGKRKSPLTLRRVSLFVEDFN